MKHFIKLQQQLMALARNSEGAVSEAFVKAADMAEAQYYKARSAAKNEPAPTRGNIEVLPEVMADFKARSEMGRDKYGTTLHTNNGRDAMNDAYQESIDLVMYLKQQILERG